ncbi:unnamed protein product [Dibothriocephalus latus]|uniref:LRRCT domain-containing protein n=1 Tax=Dibothriocephalus latus TaxID=60516 RepID=A0A3P7M4S3_DIBLA|nr:unnamed protein product [Dibothriocephalus latus]
MWWATKGPWVNLPIYIKVLWIYLFSLTYANFTTKALNTAPFSDFRARPWNLHGAQDFYPCTFKRSSPEVEDPDMIECEQKASQMMGNTIPTIYPDDRVVREIRINIEAELTFIPARAFEYVGPSLHTLTICGGGLRLTRRGAFDGISSQLYDLRLVNNGLRSIKETAFDGSLCAKSIKRLAIEQQPPNSEWIKDLRKWAKDMKALEEVSLSGNDLSTTRELDFGQSVNRALRLLRLENCSLTAIGPRGGLSLERIGDHLRELYVGGNLFNVTDQNSKDALMGVVRFSQLQLLSFAGNRGNMTRLPDWLGKTTIRSLDLSHTHLQQIGPGDLPKELQTLKLQACTPHELEPTWSQKMVGLRELVLDETDLKTIMVGNTSDASDFELARTRIDLLGFSNLRKVLISRNYLTYLPSGTFRSVPRLRELHVRDNLLQSIGDPNWSGQYDKHSREDGQLRIIDLTNNAITTLSRCSPALAMLQQEMHPDCNRRKDLYEETFQRSCRSLPPPKPPVETEDSTTAADDDEFHYIFRPLPPQKIIRIKEDYAIFYLRFWPVEGEEEALHGPFTSHVTIKGAGKQEYIFSAQPVYSNRAYTRRREKKRLSASSSESKQRLSSTSAIWVTDSIYATMHGSPARVSLLRDSMQRPMNPDGSVYEVLEDFNAGDAHTKRAPHGIGSPSMSERSMPNLHYWMCYTSANNLVSPVHPKYTETGYSGLENISGAEDSSQRRRTQSWNTKGGSDSKKQKPLAC